MTDARQLAGLVGGQGDRLNCGRLMACHGVHLCTGQLNAHGTPYDPGRNDRQQRMRPDVSFASEAPAHVTRNDGDFLWGDFQCDRHEVAQREDALTCLEDRQTSARIPSRHGGVRFHLVVVPIGGGVDALDPDRAVREPLCRVPHRGVHRPQELRRIERAQRGLGVEYHGGLHLVLDRDQRTGVCRLIQRVGDYQCHRLSGIVNLIVLQHQIALAVWMQVNPRLLYGLDARHVAVGEHGHHAGRPFRGRRINGNRTAVGDRAMHDRPVQSTCERHVRRVLRATGDLESPFETSHWLSYGTHARAPAVCSALNAQR